MTRPRLSLAAPPAAWTIQGLLGWFIGARVCSSLSPAAARAGIVLVSAAALLVALRAVAAAYGQWRSRVSGEVAEFAATSGLFVAGTFSVAILWAGLSVFVHACGVVR